MKQSFYQKEGKRKNKTIVFLHGFLEDHTIWQPITRALSTEYFTLSIDLLGHGQSPTIAPVHTMEMMANQVNDILLKEEIEHCTIVGHSMGGYVALAFAELFPKKTEGIVLLNSTTLPDSPEKKVNRDRVLKVIDKEKELFVRTAVTNLFSDENKTLMKPALNKLIDIAMHTPNEGIKAASLGMKQRPDRTELFEQLTAKKHIIMGKKDALIPSDSLIALAEKAGASYTLLSGGHLVYIENEAETIEALHNFMTQP